MVTFWAILKALPQILSLIQLLAQKVRDAEQRGIGRQEAVAEALTIAQQQIATANAAEIRATQSHAKDKTDGAFDQDFKEG
jgi:hypothetical protein